MSLLSLRGVPAILESKHEYDDEYHHNDRADRERRLQFARGPAAKGAEKQIAREHANAADKRQQRLHAGAQAVVDAAVDENLASHVDTGDNQTVETQRAGDELARESQRLGGKSGGQRRH